MGSPSDDSGPTFSHVDDVRTTVRADWRIGFESLESETAEARELSVVDGALPRGLEGTLYRIGPARHDVYGERLRHWFDGDGMVHAIHLSAASGRATYRNRFVATEGKQREDRARRRLYGGFGTRPPGNPISRFLRRNDHKNPANTSVVMIGGKLYALCEGGRPYRLDPTTLATIGEDTMDGVLDASALFSAHPKLDPVTGETFNFGIAYGKETEARIYRTSAAGETVRFAALPLSVLAMVHDFALTATKLVFVIVPLVLPRAPLGVLLGQRSFGESLRYRPELGTSIAVVDRVTGEAEWHRTDPFMMFHTIHAWDEGPDVVIDLCAYPDGRIMAALADVMAGTVPSPSHAFYERFRLRAGRPVARLRPTKTPLEFPRVAEHEHARSEAPQRVYGVSWPDGSPFLRVPIVVDVARGSTRHARLHPFELAGELVPVAKPGAMSELEGWLLTLVLDTDARRTELRIYDAEGIDAPPVARVLLPHVVPFGFHGSFVRSSSPPLTSRS